MPWEEVASEDAEASVAVAASVEDLVAVGDSEAEVGSVAASVDEAATAGGPEAIQVPDMELARSLPSRPHRIPSLTTQLPMVTGVKSSTSAM